MNLIILKGDVSLYWGNVIPELMYLVAALSFVTNLVFNQVDFDDIFLSNNRIILKGDIPLYWGNVIPELRNLVTNLVFNQIDFNEIFCRMIE